MNTDHYRYIQAICMDTIEFQTILLIPLLLSTENYETDILHKATCLMVY